MDNPLISVVMPVFNTGEMLRPAVRSVLEQSLKDWELIMIDDGSTDPLTLEICRELAGLDSRIRLFHTPNAGQSAARNAALAHLRGEWITYLDSDDILHSEALKSLYKAAIGCGVKMAVAPVVEVRSGNVPKGSRPDPTVCVREASDLVRDVLYQRGRISNSVGGRLIHRSIALAVPFPEGVYYEDLATSHRQMFLAGQIAVLSTPLYFYLQHPASFTHTFSPKRAVVIDVVEGIVAEMQTEHPELVGAAISRAVSAAFNILRLMRTNGYSDPALRERCKEIIRRYRSRTLADPSIRLKNRLALLASRTPLFRLL